VLFYNVALAAGADEALRGVIAEWAAVSAAISLPMSLAREQGTLGRIVAGVGGAVWSLVTFLVVPVLALIDAIKRSAHLFRQRWGQRVTGNVVIGGIAGLGVVLGVVVGVIGVVVMASGGGAGIAAGALLLLIGLVIAIAGAVFGGATRGVFGVALYRYVAENAVVGPFTAPELEGAARAR
jgi:hypothetical protein